MHFNASLLFFWSPVFLFLLHIQLSSLQTLKAGLSLRVFHACSQGLCRTLVESSHVIKYQTATTKTSLDKLMLGCTFYMFMVGRIKTWRLACKVFWKGWTNTWMGVFSLTRVKDELAEKIKTHSVVILFQRLTKFQCLSRQNKTGRETRTRFSRGFDWKPENTIMCAPVGHCEGFKRM